MNNKGDGSQSVQDYEFFCVPKMLDFVVVFLFFYFFKAEMQLAEVQHLIPRVPRIHCNPDPEMNE